MRIVRRVAIALGSFAVALMLPASGASAHPLGNFSINHSHNLTFEPTRLVDRAIVDFAEIPTAQAGQVSSDELARRAPQECEALRERLTLTVDGEVVGFTVSETSFTYEPGQAGLPTSRLTCQFDAQVDLSVPRQVTFVDRYESDRIGWREISATGDGIRLIDSPVPTVSPTEKLRTYPSDLLSSPLDVREFAVATALGTAGPAMTTETAPADSGSASLLHGGPFASVVERISATFDDLVGRRDLTLGVGLLAVALAMVLGASHALLPGHGKTVMAAYIAGRQGTTRDAVVVGATVTATHTGGVLLLGLALTLSSSLTGESVLGWLGVISGLIIAVLGVGLLRSARRHEPRAHGHHHALGHRHHHHHPHEHPHGDHHDHHPSGRRRFNAHSHHDHRDLVKVPGSGPLLVVRDRRSLAMAAIVATPSPQKAPRPVTIAAPVVPKATEARPVSRRGLIGMGVAGGLVPSPSALIVLLSAIALGRTAFGVLLVIGYGLGMAATLTLAGLLLVRVRDRLQRRSPNGWSRTSAIARRWTAISPYAMALFVLAVGAGIALRGLGSLS